jgi:BirA family biotin operon repressor/biotin-[acetyl-CoA-carboxylase] ligase
MTPKLEVYDSLPSTMDRARELAASGAEEFTTVLARHQSAGVGRRGRSWFSPRGGLYLTTILRPSTLNAEARARLTLVAGVSTAEALHSQGAAGVRLKWPNDLMVGRKKLGGILCQNEGEAVLVGIGINRSERGEIDLPDAVQFRFIGLLDLLESVRSPEELAQVLLESLDSCYRQYLSAGFAPFAARYRRLDALVGQRLWVETSEGQRSGDSDGIDDVGRLRVITEDGPICVESGEVMTVGFGR